MGVSTLIEVWSVQFVLKTGKEIAKYKLRACMFIRWARLIVHETYIRFYHSF